MNFEEAAGGGFILWVYTEEEKSRLLTVLKRGINTLSPSDPEIVRLIQEMEK